VVQAPNWRSATIGHPVHRGRREIPPIEIADEPDIFSLWGIAEEVHMMLLPSGGVRPL